MQRKLTIYGLEVMRFRDISFPYLLLGIFLISLILTVTFSPTNQIFIQSQSAYQSESEPAAGNTSTDKPELPIEMEVYRDILEAFKMETIQVEAHLKKNTQLWDSKLRGKPYLPKDAEYPKDIEGNPLILLAQINFAEVPELEGYPNEGILQFFISDAGQDHIWGLNLAADEPFDADKYLQSLKEQNYFRIVYYPTVTTDIEKLQTRFPAFPDAVLPVDDEAKLTFTKKSEYISIFDYRFERAFGQDAYDFFERFGERKEDIIDQYLDFSEQYSLGKIGGYAYFVQEDPRVLAPQEEEWLLLFQLDSGSIEGGGEVLWGDAGVGNFHITKEALRNLDFSNVIYYWGNH